LHDSDIPHLVRRYGKILMAAEACIVNDTPFLVTAISTIAASPLALLTWAGPVTDDAVTIGFRQHIAANQALRTGVYAKTLTFTLATTSP